MSLIPRTWHDTAWEKDGGREGKEARASRGLVERCIECSKRSRQGEHGPDNVQLSPALEPIQDLDIFPGRLGVAAGLGGCLLCLGHAGHGLCIRHLGARKQALVCRAHHQQRVWDYGHHQSGGEQVPVRGPRVGRAESRFVAEDIGEIGVRSACPNRTKGHQALANVIGMAPLSGNV